MQVDTAISDLFFNTVHAYDLNESEPWTELRQESEDFLASLDSLGIQTPSPEALMNDFKERV